MKVSQTQIKPACRLNTSCVSVWYEHSLSILSLFWHVMSCEWLTWCMLFKFLFGELCDFIERGWVRGYGPREFGHPSGRQWPFPGSAEVLALLLCLDTASSFIRTLYSNREWAHRVCSCLPHLRLMLVIHQIWWLDLANLSLALCLLLMVINWYLKNALIFSEW